MLSFAQNPTRRAIAYYRHSAEDKQENSVLIQREHTEKFALKHNIEIIHEEADEGVSGLTSNRPGFKRLFTNWIENPDAPSFDYVLVLDVSRWGRFQNDNEGAYYRFRCSEHGKQVIYVSMGFPTQEQQMMFGMQTTMEQTMAAAYSRQLSDKVFYGSVKVSQQGYSAGGTACYGMARILLDEQKKPVRALKKGEHKQIANERVTFEPLNDETTDAVREMFRLFIDEWLTLEQIADRINEKGTPSATGGPWNRQKVLRILSNETYTGSRIYNRTWGRLKQKSHKNPRSEWVVQRDAFTGIVSLEQFSKAQERLYWLMPSRWKRGTHRIKRVTKLVREEIEKFLAQRGMSDDERFLKAHDLPVLFAVSTYRESTPHWCFLIPEGKRRYDLALGISVNLETEDPIDKIFLIPTDDFGNANLVTFSEKDQNFPGYHIQRDQVEEKLEAVLHSDSHARGYQRLKDAIA